MSEYSEQIHAEAEDCLWCGKPTDQRIGGPSGQRSTPAGRDSEPWHLACFAERQAWDMAVGADNASGRRAGSRLRDGRRHRPRQLGLELASALRPEPGT